MRPLRASSAALGRPMAAAAAAATGLGALCLAVALASGRAVPALASLAAAWLFCAGLAAGGIALSAAIRLAGGSWAGAALPVADACLGFFAPALILLLVLVLGAPAFVPWIAEAAAGRYRLLLLLRQIVPAAILFGSGWFYVSRVRRGAPAGPAGAAYLLLYAVVLSLWAYDFVMELRRGPPSTVVPAYYFLGSFLSALAWVGLITTVRGPTSPALRHDLGKLMFGLIIVWSYLLWAIFLPTWYGNIPEEVAPLLARWRGPYRPLTIAVLIAVFLWPFWLLFSESLKRRRLTLGLGAATILVGLLGERFLLVLPSLVLTGGPLSFALGAGVALGVIGLFLLAVGSRLPPVREQEAPGFTRSRAAED